MNRTTRGYLCFISSILLLLAFLLNNSRLVTAEPSPSIPISPGHATSQPLNGHFIDSLTFDTVIPPGAPDVPLDDTVEDPNAHYYHIPGTMFNPVPDAGIVIVKAYGGTNGGNGCIYINNLEGRTHFLVAPVDLPDGARIAGIRLFYYDFDSYGDIILYLDLNYANGLGAEELARVQSQDASPHRNSTFMALDHIVDRYQNNYHLVAAFQAADEWLQLCGARIMYYIPRNYYLPLINRD